MSDLQKAAQRAAENNARHTPESLAEHLAQLFPDAEDHEIWQAAEAAL